MDKPVAALNDLVDLRTRRHNGTWKLVASVNGPRSIEISFDVPQEIIARLGSLLNNAQHAYSGRRAQTQSLPETATATLEQKRIAP